MDELNHRLYLTHYFKSAFFEDIKSKKVRPFLENLNYGILDTVATVYGTYSYLEFLEEKQLPVTCKLDDIKIDTDTLEPTIRVDQTMKDLNILILTKGFEEDKEEMKDIDISKMKEAIEAKYRDIYDSSKELLTTLKTLLETDPRAEFPYSIVIKTTNTKKVFTGTTLSLLITTNRGLDIPSVKDEPFITIDICKDVDPEPFKEFIDFHKGKPLLLPTLTKFGYKILNSFVYNRIVMGDIPVNKVRDKVIMSLFTEKDALKCVDKCKKLFPNETKHSSIIFRQFLDFFNVPILTFNEEPVNEYELNFAQLRSVFNSRVLELKHGSNPNLRQVINTFLTLIDINLRENEYGCFVKAGGEAFRHYKDVPDFLVVNDIDARVVLYKPTANLIQIVYQNIMVCLYFLVRWANDTGIIQWEELRYTFKFAGKEFTYTIKEISRKDFPLAISCRGSPYTFLSCKIKTYIDRIDTKDIEIFLNPLDISIEEESYEKKEIEIMDAISPPVVNKEYFIKDLSELLSAIELDQKVRGNDPLRTLRRWYKGKLNKDIERYNILMKLKPPEHKAVPTPKKATKSVVYDVEEPKAENPKKKQIVDSWNSWFNYIKQILYTQYKKYFPIEESLVNNTKSCIIPVEQHNLDKTYFFHQKILEMFSLVWDSKFNEKYLSYLKQNNTELIRKYTVLVGSFNSRKQCTCRKKDDTRTSECPFTFSQYLMCSFIDQTREEICLLYKFINKETLFKDDSDFFINILTIVTKLREMEYSDDTITIKTVDPIDDAADDSADVPMPPVNEICTFQEHFNPYDFCFLEWYISNTEQYKTLNEKLRNNIPLSFVEEIVFFELDRTLRKGIIKNGTILYKGVNTLIDMSKSQSFFSTTANKYVALDFAKQDPDKMYTIKVSSEDIHGIYLPLLGLNIKEDECLFPPNINFVKIADQTYKLTSQSFTSKGKSIQTVKCEKKDDGVALKEPEYDDEDDEDDVEPEYDDEDDVEPEYDDEDDVEPEDDEEGDYREDIDPEMGYEATAATPEKMEYTEAAKAAASTDLMTDSVPVAPVMEYTGAAKAAAASGEADKEMADNMLAPETCTDTKSCMKKINFLIENLEKYTEKDIEPLILELAERKFTKRPPTFDAYYERKFAKLMMKYSKFFRGLTNLEERLNADLTLEKKFNFYMRDIKKELDKLGGIDEFDKKGIYEKMALAKSLGLSIDEFETMALANSLGISDDEFEKIAVESSTESKRQPTSIRQLLNQFIATTNKHLVRGGYGQLVKKGGETLRYYTQEYGEKLTNDIDSEFCFKDALTEEEQIPVIKRFLPNVLKSMIVLAKIIKKIDFKVDVDIVDVVSGAIIGKISSYEKDRNLVPEYASVRTNYVGNCYPYNGGNKGNPECLTIASIDINFRIELKLNSGKEIVFYHKTAPYDFLISKKMCVPKSINDRGGIGGIFTENNLPPIVSLYAELVNLKKLLTLDVEKRKKAGKHNKDFKRGKALMAKIIGLRKKPINDIIRKYLAKDEKVTLEKMSPILTDLIAYIEGGHTIDIPLDETYSAILDQLPCKNIYCDALKQEIDLIWSGKARKNDLLDIPSVFWLNRGSDKLKTILDLNPGQTRNVYA